MNTTALEALRGKAAAKPAKKTWAPPAREDLATGMVIAVDQSLGATGIVAMSHEAEKITVWDAASYESKSNEIGHEANLRRTLDVSVFLHEFLTQFHEVGWVVRHELPLKITQVSLGYRPESSLLAAAAVRFAADDLSMPVAEMMDARRHKKITSGNANAGKIEHHAALMTLAADLGITGLEKVTNEGKRDALSIAIAHLYVEKNP